MLSLYLSFGSKEGSILYALEELLFEKGLKVRPPLCFPLHRQRETSGLEISSSTKSLDQATLVAGWRKLEVMALANSRVSSFYRFRCKVSEQLQILSPKYNKTCDFLRFYCTCLSIYLLKY